MYKKRLLSLLLIVLIISSLFLVGCQQKGNLTKVRLIEVTHSVFYAPQYVAMSKGFFEEEGIKIELINGKGADKCMTALLSGEADISFMGSEASIYVYNQGKDDFAVNFAQLTQKDGSFLVSREKDENFSFDKLKGKTIIGGRIGGMPEMTLEYVLRKNGIDPSKDIKLRTDIQFDVMAGAFVGGEGDYVALFEPVATSIEKEGKGHIVASIGAEGGYIPYTSYSTTKEYLAKNPDTVQKFTNAIYKGMLWVQSQSPEEVASVLKEHFPDADEDTLSTLVARYKEQDTWKPDPVMTEEGFEHIQNIMIEAGQLDKKVPYESLVITDFAKKAIESIKLENIKNN